MPTLGYHNMILTYMGIVLLDSHTSFTVLPGRIAVDTCTYKRASFGHYEARRVHSWTLRCFDMYNNRVELDHSKLSATVIPDSFKVMLTFDANHQGDVSIHLRQVL